MTYDNHCILLTTWCVRNWENTWLGGLFPVHVMSSRAAGLQQVFLRLLLHSHVWCLSAPCPLSLSPYSFSSFGDSPHDLGILQLLVLGRSTDYIAYGFQEEGSRSSQVDKVNAWKHSTFSATILMKWRNRLHFLIGKTKVSLQKNIWIGSRGVSVYAPTVYHALFSVPKLPLSSTSWAHPHTCLVHFETIVINSCYLIPINKKINIQYQINTLL